jgi:4-azaleucine resistance transporter AzlC
VKLSPELKQAFKISMPSLFAYFPLGMVFTILWLKSGFPAYWAPIMSVFAFAGAVQLVALSMMQEHASVIAILLAVSFIASRNLFYGLSLIGRYQNKPKLIKAFLNFGLVDATYGMLMTNPEKPGRDDTAFCFYVTLWPYIYWVLGTFSGLFLFSYMSEIKGLDFMLTGFFTVLVIDYYLVSRDKLSLIMPIAFACFSFLIFPTQYFLLSILFSVLFIYISEAHQEKQAKGDAI